MVFHKSAVSPSSDSLLEMQILDLYAGSAESKPGGGKGRVGRWQSVFSRGLQVIFSSLRLKFEITALQVKTCSKKSIYMIPYFDVTQEITGGLPLQMTSFISDPFKIGNF